MTVFRYQQGDRPLDGYSIQYGLGRGGFGEVYYAESDAGRQVALKEILNYEDIELRGIGHCMNLKSQHLVSIFDVKKSADETPWVIMEFISGPSLRDILDEHPEGLGEEKALFFVRELAKGLAYLHNAGVVHRDLKPHNIFFEDGVVKIGDYSLSKVITSSHRSGHTMTVGSVHYMAPEISVGSYDKTVDIYALGVILFEMLTGAPPFVGESMGEVLMKHLSHDPDLSGIAQPMASAIGKAMARDPKDRYQTAEEMVVDILGAEHAEQHAADFGPASLSIAAGFEPPGVAALENGRRSATESARKKQDASTGRVSDPMAVTQSMPYAPDLDRQLIRSLGRSTRKLLIAFGIIPEDRPICEVGKDRIHVAARYAMAVAVAGTMLLAVPLSARVLDLNEVWLSGYYGPFNAAVLMVALFVGTIVARSGFSVWTPKQDGIKSRVVNVVSCLLFFIVLMPTLVHSVGAYDLHVTRTFAAVLIAMTVQNWNSVTLPNRSLRVRFLPALASAIIASTVGSFLWDTDASVAAIACGLMLAVQVAAPMTESNSIEQVSNQEGASFAKTSDSSEDSHEPSMQSRGVGQIRAAGKGQRSEVVESKHVAAPV